MPLAPSSLIRLPGPGFVWAAMPPGNVVPGLPLGAPEQVPHPPGGLPPPPFWWHAGVVWLCSLHPSLLGFRLLWWRSLPPVLWALSLSLPLQGRGSSRGGVGILGGDGGGVTVLPA